MIDIKLLRENAEIARESQKKRQESDELIDKALDLDAQWKSNLQQVDQLKHKRNQVNLEIAKSKKEGKSADSKIKEMRDVNKQIEELDKKTRGLAVSFNLKVIVHESGRTRDIENSMYVSNTALLRGKPAISTEVGYLGRTDEEDVLEVMRGNYNIMKHLGMMKGKPDIRYESVWVEEYLIIRSEHEQGLFYPLVSRGDHVEKNELVGYLTDYFGNRLQDVHSPFDGIILYIIATPPMNEGEPMVSVGRFFE